MRIGFHVSIQDGLDKAVDRASDLTCNTFQMFTRSPRAWAYSALDPAIVDSFRKKLERSQIDPVFIHTPYLLNLSSPDETIYTKSVDALVAEVNRSDMLGISYVVTHLGSHLGKGVEVGLQRVTSAIRRSLTQNENGVVLLLENKAGGRNTVGSSFEELGEIIRRLNGSERVGICLDTCHCFAAGYDLGTESGLQEVLATVEDSVGLNRLNLVHLNDSEAPLGSQVDRHEHIGLGKIGEEGFKRILSSPLATKPMILETPVDTRRTDMDDLTKVRELARNVQT